MRSLVFFLIYSCVFIAAALSDFNLSPNKNADGRSGYTDAARRGKHKFHLILPIVAVTLMIKSIIFPLVIKAMAVMTSVAVLLSFMSLIISSIVGFVKLAQGSPIPTVKLLQKSCPYRETTSLPIFRTQFTDYASANNADFDVIDHYHTFVE